MSARVQQIDHGAGSQPVGPEGGATKGPWRTALTALFVAALLALLWTERSAVIAWKEDASPLPFFLAMAVLPAAGIPMTPFFVFAGATFDVRVGLLGSAVALAANLTLCYWLAGTKLRPRLETWLKRSRRELPDFRDGSQGGFRFTVLVKLTPGVPGFMKHYLLGLAGVPFPQYLGASMLITGAYGASLVVLGESAFNHELSPTLVVVVALSLAVGVVIWLIQRRARRSGDDQPTRRSGRQ